MSAEITYLPLSYEDCIKKKNHALKNGKCGWCNKEIKAEYFHNKLSIDEYFISALCMDCQLEEFGE
jgi:hypothetical protein